MLGIKKSRVDNRYQIQENAGADQVAGSYHRYLKSVENPGQAARGPLLQQRLRG